MLQCKSCMRLLDVNVFQGCKCFCFECQLNKNSLGNCECGEHFETKIACCICYRVELKPYINRFSIFCNGHLHCNNCIKKCNESFKCLKCKESLEQHDIRKVLEYGYIKCQECHGFYEAKYFLSENCCGIKLCVICQSKNSFRACSSCTTPFESDIRSFLKENKLLIE